MYIVIEIQTNASGAVGNFVWAFETRDEAFAKYHAVLSSAAVSSLPIHACVILQNDGLQIAAQHFDHRQPEPEPEPEPEE